MEIAPFSIEEFYAKYEFSVPHNLSASDCESVTIAELLRQGGASLRELGEVHLGYTESQGHPLLRAQIAARYKQATVDDVLVLTAPEEGIYILMHALLDPEDEVVVTVPAYDSLRNVAAYICGEERVRPWPVTPTDAGWSLDVDQLADLLGPKTRLLIVNFPHNPTGFLPTPEQFAAIVDMARKRGIWLFCDEMYRGLELDRHRQLPSAVDLYERAVVLAGLSKVHGLPGLRNGWLVVRDERLRDQIMNWKHYTTICPPAPSEYLAMTALGAEPALVQRNVALITKNLAIAEGFFRRHPDLFTFRRPQAGSVALVGVNAPSAIAFCLRLIEEAGVLLLPGPYLGYDDRHVRFGFGRADFTQSLAALEHYVTADGNGEAS